MKICIISSAGGHLAEALRLREAFEKHRHFFVTFGRKDAVEKLAGEKKYFVSDPKRNPIKFVFNFFQSLRILLKENPDTIISTGAGMAIPMLYLGKMFGKKIIYVESMAAVCKPSFTGRVVYLIADLFIIQWKELSRFYPKAKYGGTLI